MVKTNYTLKTVEDMAKAYGRDLSISTKAAINICNTLRGMDAAKAVVYLDQVIVKKQAIAYTRFTDGVGHRRGPMASGRFPVKAATAIQAIIKSAIANAANQGLAENLTLVHICAHKAATPFHQGRQRRRAMKRTHIEVALKEAKVTTPVVKKAAPKKTTPAPKAKATEAKATQAHSNKVEGVQKTHESSSAKKVEADAQ